MTYSFHDQLICQTFVLSTSCFGLISKQTLAIPLTSGQYLYRLTVPTTLQLFTTGKCSSNTPIMRRRHDANTKVIRQTVAQTCHAVSQQLLVTQYPQRCNLFLSYTEISHKLLWHSYLSPSAVESELVEGATKTTALKQQGSYQAAQMTPVQTPRLDGSNRPPQVQNTPTKVCLFFLTEFHPSDRTQYWKTYESYFTCNYTWNHDRLSALLVVSKTNDLLTSARAVRGHEKTDDWL